MSDKKTKQDGDSLVKKLLSSNLTWSVVALIVLIVICTISDHQFLSLSWNKNTGGLSGPLITMLQESARYLMIATGMTLVISTGHRYAVLYPYRRQHRPFRRFRYGGCRCGGHADADFRR